MFNVGVKRTFANAAATARPDRRQAILLAAEKLFALRGYHAVTIRQIADEAGVPLALVGYYFGAKHELFAAIFTHWGATRAQRLADLAAVVLDPTDAATLPAIVRAFVLPVVALRASAEGEYCALLMARLMSLSVDEVEPVLRNHFDPLAHAFIDALGAALPQATRGQVAWCYQFALGALQHHLSDVRVERLSLGQCQVGDPAAAAYLVDFIVGGFRAALPPAAAPPPSRPAARPGATAVKKPRRSLSP